MTLHSFGFNGFKQTSNNSDSTIIKKPVKHKGFKVLFASWETTILQGEDELIIWGYKPNWFDKLNKCHQPIDIIFGAPNTILGMLIESTLMCVTCKGISFKILNVQHAVYCSSMESIFVLLRDNDIVQQYDLNGNIVESNVLQGVKSMCSSNTHVLFSMKSSNIPLYGLGSNRLSQLGFDYQHGLFTSPEIIEYFNELGIISSMDCGSFHSAVIINGDLYTFGWNKDGRLGWGSIKEEDQEDGIIRCAIYLNDDNEEVEVDAIKVVCGSSHTLVLDKDHTVWSCGSNKYHCLGRDITEEYDPYFRRCSIENVQDIQVGDWNSFLLQ